jgi:ABC-type sugar transport system permease subunit
VLKIRRRERNPKLNITENQAGYLFITPTILVMGTFVVLPILYAVFLSLQKVQLLGGISGVSLEVKFDYYLSHSLVKNTALPPADAVCCHHLNSFSLGAFCFI